MIVRDVFGREVNETGIVLVDWEGHIANPLMKYSVELPGATAILSSTEPRLYFDFPSLAGADGPTKNVGLGRPLAGDRVPYLDLPRPGHFRTKLTP